MKHILKILTILFVLSLTACQQHPPRPAFFDGYQRTNSGLYYQFHERSHSGEAIHVGDMVLAMLNFYWCEDRMETAFTDIPAVWMVEQPLFLGDLTEGFLMMQVGDKASFIMPADSIILHWGTQRGYMSHLCDYFRATIRIDSIYYAVDLVTYKEEREEQRISDSIQKAFTQTMDSIGDLILTHHIRQNNITVRPNNDGVFVVVVQRGSGRRIRNGHTVVFDYTARLLDGRVLDSSCEDISYYAGLTVPWRHYKPEEIVIGERHWMFGLDDALIGQRVGTKLRVFIPSRLFATHGNIRLTAGYQPVVIDIEILEVR